MNLSEYEFYKEQLNLANKNHHNSIAVSVEFLKSALEELEHLRIVQKAYEAYKKAN